MLFYFDMAETDKVELIDLDEEDYDTVLASDIIFDGIIKFEKPFMIKGTVQGTIQSSSDLMISEYAKVKAKINADRVIIKGEVIGKVLNRAAYIACIVYATHEELSNEVIFIREGKGV